MGDSTGNVGFIRNNAATSKANIISGSQTGFWLDGADGSITSNQGFIGGFNIGKYSLTSSSGSFNVSIRSANETTATRGYFTSGILLNNSRETLYSFGQIQNTQQGSNVQLLINGVGVGGGVSSSSIKENIENINLEDELKILLDHISFKKYNYKYGFFNNDLDLGFLIEDIKSLNIPTIQESILYEPRKVIINEQEDKFYSSWEEAPEGSIEITVQEYDVDSFMKILMMAIQLNHKRLNDLEERIKNLENE